MKHRIEKDIAELLANNLLTPEQGSDIVNYYKTKNKPTFESSMLLPLIGVLLIGAGFIALCASNWENMTDIMRLIIAFIPITVLSLALFNYKDSNSHVLVQCLSFGVSFALLFGFGIVSNVYQTPIDTEILMHVCLFCVIPLVYVFDGYWLGVIALAFGISCATQDYIIISLIGMLSMLPYCYFKVKEKLNIYVMVMLHIAVLFRSLGLIYPEDITICIGFSTLVLISLFFKNSLYQSVIKISILTIGIIASVTGVDFVISSPADFVVTLIYISMLGYSLYYTFNNEVENKTLNYHLIGILTIGMLGLMDIDVTFIYSLLMIYVLMYNAFDKFKQYDLKGYNFYSSIFTGFILMKMSTLNLLFMTQGIIFIAMGVTFIFLSDYVSKTIKAQQILGGADDEEIT